MGELFKYFEGWDVQALRQEIKEAKEEAEREKEKAEEENETSICKFLKGIKKYKASKEEAVSDLMEAYGLGREKAEETVTLYWQKI